MNNLIKVDFRNRCRVVVKVDFRNRCRVVVKVDFRNRCRVVERTITHEDTIFQRIADVTRCIEQTEDPDYILELELKLNELYATAANSYDMVADLEVESWR